MQEGRVYRLKKKRSKVCRNCPSKNSLLSVWVMGRAPFAAVGDRTDLSAIFDADGNPLTINSHPTGYPGYVSPAIAEKGIKSIFYKDGPAGIGGIAWPTEMLIACSFDKKMWQMFGDAVGKECEEQQGKCLEGVRCESPQESAVRQKF